MRTLEEGVVSILLITLFKQCLVLYLLYKDYVEINCHSEVKFNQQFI